MSTRRIETPPTPPLPETAAVSSAENTLQRLVITNLAPDLQSGVKLKDATRIVEETLKQYSACDKTLDLNLEALTQSVENSTNLGHGDKSLQTLLLTTLHSIKQKRKGEAALRPLLPHNEHFASVKEDELWRFFIDGNRQRSGNVYEFDNEPGYYGALCKGWAYILPKLGQPMTVDMYEELQGICVDQVGRKDECVIKRDPDQPSCLQTIRKGYRDRTYSSRYDLYLHLVFEEYDPETSNATFSGLAALQDKFHNDNWLVVTQLPVNTYGIPVPLHEIHYKKATRQECQERVGQTLDRYQRDIERAQDESSKRRIILECCQTLAQIHAFADGNIRAINLVMNKMLMENNLSPTIMQNPNGLDAFDMNKLEAELVKGQKNFKKLCYQPSYPVSENSKKA